MSENRYIFPEVNAGLYCPICGRTGQPLNDDYNPRPLYECKGQSEFNEYQSTHPPILPSWQHESIEAYERLYTEHDIYHTRIQQERGVPTMTERDTEHLTAAYQRVLMLLRYRPIGFLVDIGAGEGAFVAMAQSANFKALGIEINQSAVDRGCQLGRRMVQGSWDYLEKVESPSCDIITAHDIYEHLLYPNSFLKTMYNSLVNGGLLVIDTPEWDGDLTNRHIRPAEHVALYSEGALRQMAERVGFKIEGFHRPLGGSIGKMCFYLGKSS